MEAIAMIPNRIRASGTVRHEDKDGNLICYCEERFGENAEFLAHWDEWRAKYCDEHRKTRLPISFREGKFTIGNALLSIFLGYKGGN